MSIAITTPTKERISAFKAFAAQQGTKVRVRKHSGSLRGAVRVVIVSGDFAGLRDAAVLSNTVNTAGTYPTNPEFRHGFSGAEINLYFCA